MKFRIVKYSISWLAVSFLIAGATMGLIVSFKHIESSWSSAMLLSLAWLMVVASGIYLFNYASKEILRKELAKEEELLNKEHPEIKREKKKPITESESLNIDQVARKIVRRLSTEDSPSDWGNELLAMLSTELEIMSGVFYFRNKKNIFESVATFAFVHAHEPYSFIEGEGLTGQTASNKAISVYTTIPDDYSEVFSGLGNVKPTYIAMVPIVVKEKCIAVIECAGFKFQGEEIEHLFQIVAREISAKISDTGEADNVKK